MLAVLDAPAGVVSTFVTAVADAVGPLLGDDATAGTVVLVTVAVRLVLLPLSYRAARAMHRRQALRPDERKLRERFRADPPRLRKELAALYRKHDISPFAGIAPLLAQIPFVVTLYRLFSSPTVNGQANLLLTHTLLGAPLGDRWISTVAAGTVSASLLVFGAVFMLLIVVAWWSSRQADPELPRLLRLMPFTTVLAAGFVPLAAALYILTTTAWSAAERAAFGRNRPAPAT